MSHTFTKKDLIIAITTGLLAVVCIVFYFLPVITVLHDASPGFVTALQENFSGFDITNAMFSNLETIPYTDYGMHLLKIKIVSMNYPLYSILIGVFLPLVSVALIITSIFTFLACFKGEKFKIYGFIASLCGTVFAIISTVAIWLLADVFVSGDSIMEQAGFYINVNGSIGYATFVILAVAFVCAIEICAYNYFVGLDPEDEDDEDDEDEDEDEYEIKVKPKKKAKEDVKEKHFKNVIGGEADEVDERGDDGDDEDN